MGEAGGAGAGCGGCDHRGIDVERVDGVGEALRERDGEGAVTAAEFGDRTDQACVETEGVEDERHVEERFPIGLGGHAAFTNGHR